MPLSRKYSAIGHGGQGDPQSRSRRLIHLPEHQGRVGQDRVIGLRDLGPLHFEPEVVSLSRPLADAGKDGITAVPGGDSGDELLDDDGLSHAGAAEEPGLAASHERAEKVDHLDARLEHLTLGRKIGELGRVLMDRSPRLGVHGAPVVDGLAEEIDDSSQRLRSDLHGQRAAGIDDVHVAAQAERGAERDGPDPAAAEMLLHLAAEPLRLAPELERDFECVEDGRHLFRCELGIKDTANDLYQFSSVHSKAPIPLTMSSNSEVI